ncbi:MAG TPA: SGNH/GDSL hydrolase family protein [Polyangiaceae bacterium]|nr:SGNH/GDSL hydrolase family protein [Polyangiaceae bacterium]
MLRPLTLAILAALAAVSTGCNQHTPGPARVPDPNSPGGDAGLASSIGGGGAGSATTDAAGAINSQAGSTGAPEGGVAMNAGVRWVGRVDASNPTAVKFAWSATGLVATVNGTKVSARLQTEGATASAFFQPVIDGAAGPRFQVATGAAQTVVLGDGLTPGNHTVELYRESEGMYGDSIFSGFVDGAVRGAPPASGRLIEIVGDSISAGYGNLGTEVHPPWDNACSFSLDTESAYQAYSSILGRALNAEVSIVARSGWGMYRDGSGNTSGVLSSVYESVLGTQNTPKWDFKRQADAVVINLGTNDSASGDPGQPYEDAYVAFLRVVRGHYPNAWIFMTLGPMTSDPLLTQMRAHLANVVAKTADAKVTAVDIAAQDGTMTGCDYHPNVAEDNVMAGVLVTAMKSKLGW